MIDTSDIAMIRSGNSVRFTPNEVEEFRQVGLDLGDVECQNDIEQEVSRWAHTLADERFELWRRSLRRWRKRKALNCLPDSTSRLLQNLLSNLGPLVRAAFEITKVVRLDRA